MSISAQLPTDDDGRQYHLGVGPGDVARHVLLVGDPDRARRVAERFDEVELERVRREFITITGTLGGRRRTVIGTGISAANREITLIEMSQVVQDPVLVRCGSCGALQPEIDLGALVVSQACVRLEQTSQQFVEPGYPAVASAEVLLGLIQAADELGATHHVGLTATAGGFFGAQGRTVGPFVPRTDGLVDRLATQRVLNLEMEASCLLTLASLGGFRAGVVCAAYANRDADSFLDDSGRAAAERRCLDVGLRALDLVEDMDAQRGARPHWHPGMAPAEDPARADASRG